jgi:hypothetical protein
MIAVSIRLRPRGGSILADPRRIAALRNVENYPATAAAVARLTRDAQKTMMGAVQGKRVFWSGGNFKVNRVSGALHGAILGGYRYPWRGNPLAGALEVKHKHYNFVTQGTRAYDMKPGLLRGRSARVSKKGVLYAVVPIKLHPEERWSAVVYRVVTQFSKGWIHPGTPPRRIDLYTQEEMRRTAARRLRDALKQDMGMV